MLTCLLDLVDQNLEIKKLNEERKGAMAAQLSAEATFRSLHAGQKDDDLPPIELVLSL